ncbi:MAG: ABC transporter ATP-binding protein [Clostridia bacterium]|jgi:ATP-binding cassette subfamily B multidrug efflux pump|nr:ABC transporter ATP-binding protein [Clostridia bacterium]
MFKLARFLKGRIPAAISAPLCKLIEAIFELSVPMIIANVLDVGVASGDKSYVLKYCSIIAALAVGGFLISVTGQFLASKVALGFGTKLRDETFAKINSLPVSVADRLGGASLVTRLTGDVMNCQNALNMFLRLVMRIPFVLIGSFVMSMIIDPVVSLMFLAMAVVLGSVITCVLKLTLPRVKKAQRNLDEISRLSAQSLTGARVIRAFTKQADAAEEFDGAAQTTAHTNIVAARFSALLNPLTFAVVNLAIIAVLWFGGVKVESGRLLQGELVALINYLTQAFFVIVTIGNVFSVFTRSSACAARVNEILDMSVPEDGTLDVIPDDAAPAVEFRNVCFAYDGDYDVRELSFTLERGKTLGIIGGTGSGKSTVINLIERFYDPAEGEILFCGRPISEYKTSALRGALGYVPQKAALLCGTLDSNLRVADENVTKEREVFALETAQAKELLDSVGLDGDIVADGKNLSGGQRQRVSIARALCRDNVLYLFDDVTSALDYKTERGFIDAMTAVDGAKIYVSQRISAVSGCDAVLVLDNGKAVGYGTHEELKKTCPLYAEFCASQTS